MADAETGVTGPRISRRQIGVFGAVAGLMGSGVMGRAMAATPQVTARQVALTTPAGTMAGQFHAAADRAMPGMVVWAKPGRATDLAVQQLAAQGWAVLVLDPVSAPHSALHQAISDQAKAATAWLDRQESVASSAAKSGSLGNGYTLRTVLGVRPRLSFVSVSQRKAAANVSLLCAMPASAKLAAHQSVLADAAYMVSAQV